jgi:CRISPR-associated protein Csx17
VKHTVTLTGCSPIPLAGYLKSIALLRLVSEQVDEEAEGWWRDETFHLRSALDADGFMHFLLEAYRPSPIVAPWNRGSGFYSHRESAMAVVNQFRRAQADRLAPYRRVIEAVDGVMRRLGVDGKPKEDDKERLIGACRNHLPDEAVEWMDTVLALTPTGVDFPPLLGTGGNDGNLEFTNNFMQRVLDVMDPETGQPTPESRRWLMAALFAQSIAGLKDVSIGQFAPGSAGGPNSTTGYSGSPSVNPWEYVLMLEGAIVFSASATKRLEVGTASVVSYPFTVAPSAVANGGLAEEEEASARAEMWLPLWEHPARFREVAAIFREGRAQIQDRAARNGMEFARACARLGVDRGIDSFQRYAFVQRMGKAYLAVPLTRFRVHRRAEADLLDDLSRGGWLDHLARAARSAGHEVQSAYRRVAEAVFAVCQNGGVLRIQRLLIELGRVERLLAHRPALREALNPLVLTHSGWWQAAADGSPEFALAAGLVSLRWPRGPALRAYLSPVDPLAPHRWIEQDTTRVVWHHGDLVRNLTSVLHRRLLDAASPQWKATCEDGKPFTGWRPAPLGHLIAFLSGRVHDARIEALIWGLLPLATVRDEVQKTRIAAAVPKPDWVPWAFAVSKLVLTPDSDLERAVFGPSGVAEGEGADERRLRVPVPRGWLYNLVSGDARLLHRAVLTAERRLFASGLVPRLERVQTMGLPPRRIAAATLFPLSSQDVRRLLDLVAEREALEQLGGQVFTEHGGGRADVGL